MKYRLLILTTMISFSFGIYAQQKGQEGEPQMIELVEPDHSNEGVWFVEVNASFNGGDLKTFETWVMENLKYPEEAIKDSIYGKVIIQFSVDKTGAVCETKVIRSVNPLLDNEALRVVNSSPAWKPAKISGVELKQNFVIPVYFTLQ